MTSKFIRYPAFILILATSLLTASCGNSNSNGAGNSSDSVNKPAPDNNAANNPSLADTSYRPKDSLKKKTDTPVTPPVQ